MMTIKKNREALKTVLLGEKINLEEWSSIKQHIFQKLESRSTSIAAINEEEGVSRRFTTLTGRTIKFQVLFKQKLHHDETLFIVKQQSNFNNVYLFKIYFHYIHPSPIYIIARDRLGRIYDLFHIDLLDLRLSRYAQIGKFCSLITDNNLWSLPPLKLARFFIENVYNCRHIKILRSYEDIFIKEKYYTYDNAWNFYLGPESSVRELDLKNSAAICGYKDVVKKPKVIKLKTHSTLTFYTYEYMQGSVSKWHFIIYPEGVFGYTKEIVGKDIYFPPCI